MDVKAHGGLNFSSCACVAPLKHLYDCIYSYACLLRLTDIIYTYILDVREIGAEAVWSLSTAKAGNGVEQLRDNNVGRLPCRFMGKPILNMFFIFVCVIISV